MSCLRLWLNAPTLDAGDHSYWAPETALVAISKDKSTSKPTQKTSKETDGKGGKENVDSLCCVSASCHGECADDDKGKDRGEAGKADTTPTKRKKNKRKGKASEPEKVLQDDDAKFYGFNAECCGVDGTRCLNSTCDCSPERIKRMEALGEAMGEEVVRIMMEEASIKKGQGKKGKKGAGKGKVDGDIKKDVKSSCTSGVKSGSGDDPNKVIVFSGKNQDSSDKVTMFSETKQPVHPSGTTVTSTTARSDSSERLTIFSGKKRPVQPSAKTTQSGSSEKLTMFSGKKPPVQPSGTEAQSDRSRGTGAKLVESATGNKAVDGDNSTNDDLKTKGILRRCAQCKLVEVERKTFKKCQR